VSRRRKRDPPRSAIARRDKSGCRHRLLWPVALRPDRLFA